MVQKWWNRNHVSRGMNGGVGDRLEPGLDVAHEFDGQPVLLGSATEDHQGRRRFAVEPQHVEDGEELPGESVRVMPFSR